MAKRTRTRTTIAFDDVLLRRLKRVAAAEDRSLLDLVDELVRTGLAARRPPAYSLDLKGWKGRPQPGVDPADRRGAFERGSGR